MTRFFARVSARVGQAYTKLFPNTLKKRTWWPVFGVGVLLVAVLSVGFVSSQAVVVETVLNGLVDMIATILIELSKLCIFLTIFFLRAFITLASYNNFIDVSVVKLGWVMVRDVANMFFIVGLLVIAFATILGFESYEWKHGLVKIVLMAILINFSNLIAQLVIDVAHIFTITFLNAVSATAGGNLITLFQMDKILELAQNSPSELGATREVASLTLFAGAVLAFIFALLAALTIGAYMVVMIFRIVVLWALIVLSPLAFMLYAIPKGEKYATEWWSEFSKHVIVAPIMVFFLWLAFATLGTGQIISEIQSGPNVIQLNSSGEKQSVTVLEISTWENFASFLLGIGFLWVGIKKTEETGATGAGLVGGAIDFTKNVATIATGYAAGRWLVGGAVDKVKSDFPIIGGKSLARKGEKIAGMYKTLKTKSGQRRDERIQDMEKKQEEAKGVAGKVGWWAAKTLYGSIFESDKRKDARAENWSEIAAAADREHEAKISTSRSKGGEIKLTARVKADEAEKAKSAKGPQKMAEEWLRLQEKGDKSFTESRKVLAGAKAKSHDLEELVKTEEKQAIAKKTDDLEEHRDKGSDEFHKIRERLATLKPITEQIEQKVAGDHHYHEEKRIEELLRPITAAERAAAVGDEDLTKDIAERDEYQKYNELATTAEKKLENVKGSNKAQLDQGAAETEARLARTSYAFGQREGIIAESKARMKDIEDTRNSEKEILLLGEIAKLLASGGLTASLKAKAELESVKGMLELDQIDATAQQRAQVYESQGDHPRAEAILRKAAAEKEKKLTESFGDVQYDDKKVLEKYLIRQISNEEARQAQVIRAGGSVSQSETEKLTKLRQQKNAFSTLVAKADGDTVRDTKVSAMDELGVQEFNAKNRLLVRLQMHTGLDNAVVNDLRQQVAQQFPALNNDQREEELVKVLIQRFNDMYTDDNQRQSALKDLSGALKSAAMKGDSSGLGLIDADEDVATGKMKYKWRSVANNDPTLTAWFASRSSADSISGYADLRRDATGKMVMNGFSDHELPSIAEFYRNMDGRAMSNDKMKSVHASWNSASVTSNNIRSYLAALEQMQNTMKTDGFNSISIAMRDFVTNVRDVVRQSNDPVLNQQLQALNIP